MKKDLLKDPKWLSETVSYLTATKEALDGDLLVLNNRIKEINLKIDQYNNLLKKCTK